MTSGCPRRHCWTTWTHRTEGKGVVCWFFMPVQWVLQPWKISDIPVFVFTSGCCGGPEWAERTVFKSKPIRMHFCCIPTPPPSPSSPSRLSPYWWCHWLLWTLFPWKRPPPLWPTFQAALPPFSNHPLPPSLSPLSPFPAAQPPHHSPDEKEGLGHKRRGEGGVGGVLRGSWLLRTGRGTGHSQEDKNKAEKVPALDWWSVGRVVLPRDLGVHNSCLVWRLRESSKRYQFETVSWLSSFAFLYLAYMNICIYSCCAVGQRTAAADLLSKSSCLHIFNYYNYLNL